MVKITKQNIKFDFKIGDVCYGEYVSDRNVDSKVITLKYSYKARYFEKMLNNKLYKSYTIHTVKKMPREEYYKRKASVTRLSPKEKRMLPRNHEDYIEQYKIDTAKYGKKLSDIREERKILLIKCIKELYAQDIYATSYRLADASGISRPTVDKLLQPLIKESKIAKYVIQKPRANAKHSDVLKYKNKNGKHYFRVNIYNP